MDQNKVLTATGLQSRIDSKIGRYAYKLKYFKQYIGISVCIKRHRYLLANLL